MRSRIFRITIAVLFSGLFVSQSALAEMKMSAGGSLRLRHEWWKNTADMNNDIRGDLSFFRFKTLLWGKLDISDNYSAYVRLANENRSYNDNQAGSAEYNINELVIDNLYVDMKKLLGCALDARIGRQDMAGLYSENFIIADGTPLDGSRTFYFNAGRVMWRVNGTNSLDGIYIKVKKYDDILPVGNELKTKQALNDADAYGYGVYHKSEVSKALHWENYVFRSHEDMAVGGKVSSTLLETKLTTLGTFARYSMEPFTLRGQLAFQMGDYGDNRRRGMGGYMYADAKYKDVRWTPSGSIGYVYLSGDDTSTSDNESWDPVFGRTPLGTDLYSLAFIPESGNAYWTNLHMFRVNASVKPCEKSKIDLNYGIFYADRSVPATAVLGNGKDRGRLTQLRMDYAFTKSITSYAIVEYFTPGDFYVGKDAAVFSRVETSFKF